MSGCPFLMEFQQLLDHLRVFFGLIPPLGNVGCEIRQEELLILGKSCFHRRHVLSVGLDCLFKLRFDGNDRGPVAPDLLSDVSKHVNVIRCNVEPL